MVFINFSPILLFVFVYLGSSLYFTFHGIANAFYQLSPAVAILPALIVAWLLHRGSTKKRLKSFLDGVSHPDIIMMCMIFLFAGAFSAVTKSIGSVDATVSLVLSIVNTRFLLIGVFIVAAFISTAIGTSMGAIATIAPVALGLAQQNAFGIEIGMATVVAGAMFGDNLSLVSDTTIAAVMSQEADFGKKLRLNALVAMIAFIITVIFLFQAGAPDVTFQTAYATPLLIAPYLLLIILALCSVNVLCALIASITAAGFIGWVVSGYSLLGLSKDIAQGFSSMYDIMTLSLFVGGLTGLMGVHGEQLVMALERSVHRVGGSRATQFMIAAIVSLFDILLANNTVAIIFSGPLARGIAQRGGVPPHYSAAWLDIFSCVFQGIIPYGAQILLVSSIGGISPLVIIGKVYYCYILGAVALVYIVIDKRRPF